MGLNAPTGPDVAPTGREAQRTQVIRLEDAKLKTVEGILGETRDIIELIQTCHNQSSTHLLEFEVHGKRIGIRQWMQHGFAQNPYNIPLLFLWISKHLEEDEKNNLLEAVKKFGTEKHATKPGANREDILSGIHYYLNNPV